MFKSRLVDELDLYPLVDQGCQRHLAERPFRRRDVGSSDRDIQGAGRETALTVGMWGSQPNTAVIRAFEDAGIVFIAGDEGGGPGLRFKSNRK